MKKVLFTLVILAASTTVFSQSVGDTIVINSLNHGSATRDTIVSFPNNAGVTYSKILMKYNMRCKDGLVSDGNNRNRGCGEWDYSCNTYIHDDSRTDSLFSRQISYQISEFSGDTFQFTSNPTYDYYLEYLTNINSIGVISDTNYQVGSLTTASSQNVFPAHKGAGKSQFLFKASELSASGLTAGNIDGIRLTSVGNVDLNYLKVRIKGVSDTIINDTIPHMNGFTEVYYSNTSLTGSVGERLHFTSPYNWNGTDNLLVEFSFTNDSAYTTSPFNWSILSHTTNDKMGISSGGDSYVYFNGFNYVEMDSYKGIGGNDKRTIEAWIKTTSTNEEIVSWGRDAAGQKWNFRTDGNGRIRVEVNGGWRVGTTVVNDGQWHHVACAFGGSNVNQVALYVDGVLETYSSTDAQSVNTNNTEGINVRISRGTNNRYFTGIIDDVRIWDTVITGSIMPNWMYKNVDANHPRLVGLQADYRMNESNTINVYDSSGNQYDGKTMISNVRQSLKGIDHFKEFDVLYERPTLTFYRGNYTVSSSIDTITDSIQRNPHSVYSYGIHTNIGSQKSDSISTVLGEYWQAGFQYVYDTNGMAVDSIMAPKQGDYVIEYLPYYRRYPMRYEINSFVTPYGIGLDLGMEGETWTFDLTDFAPVLKGDRRLTMEWGGQFQEEMDIQFQFIVGTPPRDVEDITQIWRVIKPSYTNIQADLSYEPREVLMASGGKDFVIKSAITGHGQEGEFTPRNHRLTLNGSKNYTWQVWKFCGDNPVYPQGGTWVYDRAGWCPGMATDIKTTNITDQVTAGNRHKVDYNVVSASGNSNYIVSHQLVAYGDPNFNLDAHVLRILNPTSDIEFGRSNPICHGPKVEIQNTGSNDLTSLTIEYWVNDAANKESYSWSGNLGFMETEIVELPSTSGLWSSINPSGNKFYVEVSSPNGSTDEYSANNKGWSNIPIPMVMPREFVVEFKTNNEANQNNYKLTDDQGNILAEKKSLANNTTYRDTVRTGYGCYNFRLEDSGNNGISWWANPNGGNGYLWFTDFEGIPFHIIEADFGSYLDFDFTIDVPLSFEEMELKKNGYRIYPNPASDQFNIEFDEITPQNIRIFNTNGSLQRVSMERNGDLFRFNTSHLPSGLYMIQIQTEEGMITEKLLID
jgi:hypothetical protein